MTQATLSTDQQPARLQRPWVLWMMFFFQYAAIGIYFTYLNIFYRNNGLSGSQIGILNMTTSLISMGGAVLWGYLSDRTGKTRYVIALGAAGSLILAQFVPHMTSFWGFLILGIFSSLANAAPNTLVDSTTLSMLGSRREDYGLFRLGGSIGYVVVTFFSGFLLDRVGIGIIFPAYGVLMTLFCVVALLLPPTPVRQARTQAERRSMGPLLHSPVWIILTLTIFLVWIANNASIMFLGVTLSAMGAAQGLIGIAITIGAVVEIPVMFYSGRLMRRFGAVRLLVFAICLLVIRFFLLGIMPAPEWAIAINLLNGPAYGFFWNSAVTLANRMAPPEYAGTAQGLLNSTISLAGIVSSLLTGYLFDLLGPNRLFVVMAGFVLAALALFTASGMARRVKAEE